MRNVEQKAILTDRGMMKALMEEFDVTLPTVHRALLGENISTALHMRIRKRAMELGGEEKPTADVSPSAGRAKDYLLADNGRIQAWANYLTDTVTILHGDKVLVKKEHARLSDVENLLQAAGFVF